MSHGRDQAARAAVCAALVTLSLLGGACVPPQTPPAPPASGVGDDIRLPVQDPQVMALWQDAELARQTRDYTRASVRLEQAVSLEPQNPALWSRLAELRLLQEQPAHAENLAAKSNVLAVGNAPLRYRNWLIIAHARELRGDSEGAELARREAQRLQDKFGIPATEEGTNGSAGTASGGQAGSDGDLAQ